MGQENLQDFELIELLIRGAGLNVGSGPSTPAQQGSDFESFKARFQSYIEQVPSYLHSVSKEGFFPHFFLGSFSTLVDTEIAKKLDIEKIYFSFDSSKTLKVAVVKKREIKSSEDAADGVKLFVIAESDSTRKKFSYGELDKILGNTEVARNNVVRQARDEGKLGMELVEITKEKDAKGKIAGISVDVKSNKLDKDISTTHEFKEIKKGLWNNPESDIAKLTNSNAEKVKESVEEIFKKVSKIHSEYKNSLIYAEGTREAAHHGFIAGALVNFRYRYNLRVYLEQFAGRGYADIILVPRGKDRSLNVVPIIIELKAGTGRGTTPSDALEQAKNYAKGFQPNIMRVLTISNNVLCVGLNLDATEGERFSMHISLPRDRNPTSPTVQKLLEVTSSWNGEEGTITGLKKEIKQPLERIYHTFPGTSEKGGNYFSRFLLGQLLLADKFVDIDLEKSIFLYNEYPLASSTRSDAKSTERPVTTFILTKGNQGQDKEVFIFHIKEGGRGEFSEKKIPIDLPAVSKITEVCISLKEERESGFFDVGKINRYNSMDEYKKGKEFFKGELKNVPYPNGLREAFDEALEFQVTPATSQSLSVDKYNSLLKKVGEGMFSFKDFINKEAHFQGVLHGAFSYYSDLKLKESSRALILTEFQTGRGKRIDMLVHSIGFADQDNDIKEYIPIALELKGPREGKDAVGLLKEADNQIEKEYKEGITYKTLTDGDKVFIMGVVFDNKAQSSNSLIKITNKLFPVNVIHSSKVKGNINKLKRPAPHKLFNRGLNALRSFKVHSGGTISNWVDIGRDRLKNSNKDLVSCSSPIFFKENSDFLSYLDQIPENIGALDLSEMDLDNSKMEILSNFLSKRKSINSIDLSYSELNSVQVSGLINSLIENNRKISFLDLSENNIGSNDGEPEAIESLARFIETNNIDNLVISNIEITSDDFSKIFRALKKNTSIKNLDCSFNKVVGGFNKDNVRTIVDFLYNNRKLTALNLANTGINDCTIKGIEEKAQKDYQGQTIFIEELDIGNYDTEEKRITKEGTKSLAKLLKQVSKLRSLKLSGNPIGVEGLKELVSALKIRNTDIETLDISEISLECNQGNAESIADIMKSLIGELNIRELNLADNQLNAKAIGEIFSSMKNRKEQVLKKLNLAGNRIGDEVDYKTLEAISSGLQGNDVLESLNLANMDWSGADIEEIVGALKKESIIDLDISGNDIYGSTMRELSEFLQDNSRLRFLNIADYDLKKIPLPEGIENLFRTLKDHNKVLTHLNIGGYAFSDESVNIIPKYLGSNIGIQYLSLAGSEFTGDRERALNVLFEALKQSNLQAMDIRDVSITDKVANKIIECLKAKEDLQVLHISQGELSSNQVERLKHASSKISIQVEPKFNFANAGCPQRVIREIGNILCMDSRDEEKITEEEKERLIKKLFSIDNAKDFNVGVETYENEIIAVDSKRVHTIIDNIKKYRTEVYVTVRDNDGNNKKLTIDDIAKMLRIENYMIVNNNEIWLIDERKHYVITEKMEGQDIEYCLDIDGYKVKLDSIIKGFTTDAEEKAIYDKLHQLSNEIVLFENKKYIEDIGDAKDIELINQDYDYIINEVKQSLLKKGISENAFNQFRSYFDDLNEKVFAEYIGNVEGNLKEQRIEFDHNKFDLAKIKGAKIGKFFSLMAIYDLFDSIGDTATLGRYDNDALKQVFGINGILDAMDDVRTSVSISHTSKVGKLISKIPQPVRQTFVKVISNPMVQSITFATIAYQFGYSVNEIAQGNNHPLNYYWTANSGIKLASMSIRPISPGVSFTIKSVSATTKILRGLSAVGKVLSRISVATMAADLLITIGVEIHKRMEYTKAIAGQVPLLPGNEQAEVFFAGVIKFFTGRDVEKEYEDIIKVKGYLNYVKEVAIRLLDDNYNVAAVVQYVVSIGEKYSEIIKSHGIKILPQGRHRIGKVISVCELEKEYNNISFNGINGTSNVSNNLSPLNISQTLPMVFHTLVMNKGWERFICGIKNSPQCYLELNEKGMYMVNTDVKHIPHLTKYEYEDLGLRIVNAPLRHPTQKSQCSKTINTKHTHSNDISSPCNADKVYRNCQKNFTLSGEPFIFTNPTRKDPYHIRKETFPKGSVLYISGPRTLTAAANYPAVMYIPGGYVQYVGSKNNETTFIIGDLTSGTLEGGVEKENTVLINVKANNVIADLHNRTIYYGNTGEIKLVNIYNYVSNSDSKQNIITHCKTRLINAKNAEVQQNSFNCVDKDYEIRVVNKENVHHRGSKQTVFIVNEDSDNAKIASDLNYTEKIKRNMDVICAQVADITRLKVDKSIEGSGYSLDLLSDRTQDIISSIKIDNFKNLVIQTKRLGVIESVIIQDKSLSNIIEDMRYQKLNDLGKDIDREVIQNSEEKLRAIIQASILDLEWPNTYQAARNIADNNNLGIPVSEVEVIKNYVGVPTEKVIIAGMYSDRVIVDFSYSDSNSTYSYLRYRANGGNYDYDQYMVACNYYQDIMVEGREEQDRYVIKLPQYSQILQQKTLRSSIELDLNLKVKNKATLYQNVPDDIIDLTVLNVVDVDSISTKKGKITYFNKCNNREVSDLTENSLEIKNVTVSDGKGIKWSLSIGLVDYFRGQEYQNIVLQMNNKFYKINNANLELEYVEVNTKPFRYYQPNEQGLQIYHNQPVNKNVIGLVDLKEKSILDFNMKVVDNNLSLLHKSDTIARVENWNTYQPARKMIFAFNDTIVSNSNCIAFTCDSEDIIVDFNKAKEILLREHLFNAIKQNNANEVKNLIRRIADNVDTSGKYELTSLYMAIQEGRLDIVILLFGRRSVSIEDKDIHGYSPLHWAAQEGRLNIAQFLVDEGASIEDRNKNGKTPADLANQKGYTYIVKFLKQVRLDRGLLTAVESGDLNKVKDLVRQGASLEAKDNNGSTTLLHYASLNGHVDVVKYLIENRVNLEAKDGNGRTPLHYASCNNRSDVVEYLIKNGASLEAKDWYGKTPLHYASLNGHVDVVKYLIENRVNLEAKDGNGRTPLHYASLNGYIKVVDYLIKNEASLKDKDKDGNTPLELANKGDHRGIVEILEQARLGRELLTAARNSSLDKVKDLIEDGASLEIKDNGGRVPLHYAAYNGKLDVVKYFVDEKKVDVNIKDNDRKTALHWASGGGHLNVVEYLVDEEANISAEDIYRWTPLHFAASGDNVYIVRFLLDNNADIKAGDMYGNTPLHVAAQYSSKLEIVEFLLDKDASGINNITNDGWTPLHVAVQGNKPSTVKLFLGRGADIEVKDTYGQTPLDLADQKGYTDIVKILEQEQLGKELFTAVREYDFSRVEKLISRGANVDTKNKNGKTPLDIAINTKNALEENQGSLNNALSLSQQGRIVRILEHEQLNRKLFTAVREENLPKVRELISRGANIDTERDGKTPLDIAKEKLRGHSKNEECSDVVQCLEKLNQEREKPVQRKRRHHHGDHSRNHNHSSHKFLSVDSSNQPEIAASGGIRPSSWINNLFGWVKSSIGGLLDSKSNTTTKSPISQVDAPMDVNGTIMLLDVLVRKVTGQKYISTVDQPISPLEAQGYALNITKGFEKVVEQAGLKSGISMHRLNIDYMGMQKEITRKAMSGKFNEISGILKSYVEKACPGEEAGKLSSKKFDKFIAQFNKGLLNQSIQQVLHNGDGTLEVDGAKRQQMSLEPQSYLSNASLQSHSKDKVSTCLSDIGVTKLVNNLSR